jgi:hypothetical protein
MNIRICARRPSIGIVAQSKTKHGPNAYDSDHDLEYYAYASAADEKARHPFQSAIQSCVLFHPLS